MLFCCSDPSILLPSTMKSCSALALLTLVTLAESFAPLSTSVPRSTSLNLKQGQGSQLVAAWNAAHPDEDDDEQDHARHHETRAATTKHSKAREFVSRVFSIPSSMIRRHPFPQQEGLEDVVYYPVVGFQYFKTKEGKSVAVPTSNCNASCSLHPSLQEEPVYGWFTAASCPLGSLYSDDYCSEPREKPEGPAP